MSKLAGTVCGIVCGKDLNANKVKLASLLNLNYWKNKIPSVADIATLFGLIAVGKWPRKVKVNSKKRKKIEMGEV